MSTILIVDDCPDTLDLYSLLLMSKGYSVLVANSLQSAVELAYTNKRVDLLIADLCLGDGLGSELPYLMGKKAPRCHILITGQDPHPAQRFQGFHDYLIKPVDPDNLFKTVQNCLALLEEEEESKVA